MSSSVSERLTHELGTQSILKLLLRFSIPSLISNLMFTVYNVVDRLFISWKLGTDAIAGVGITFYLFMIFIAVGMMFGIGGGTLVSLKLGEKDKESAERILGNVIMIFLVGGALTTLLGFLFLKPLLYCFGASEATYPYAAEYFRILLWFMAADFLSMGTTNIIRAEGSPNFSMWYIAVGCIANVVLDYIFIMEWNWGIAGAAWATVISQLASGVWCLRFARRKYSQFQLKRQDWRFDWNFAWEHLRIALPMAFQFSITAIGVIVMQTVLNTFGSTAVAAFTAAAKIDQLAVQPGFSIGIAIATYAAQNYGAGLYRRIREGVNKCSLLSTVFAILMGAAVIVFCPQFTRLFVGDGHPEVIPLVRTYMLTNGSCYVILGLLFVYRNALQGIGRAFVPMMAGASELVVRTVAAPVLGGAIGYVGVCLSNPLALSLIHISEPTRH